MPQILLVNPRKRRGRKTRSAAQRAATAKMLAANRRRRNPKSRKSAKRRRNPAPLTVMHKANPIRRKRRASARRRNPISFRRIMSGGGSGTGVSTMLKNAALGAVGATAINTAIGRLPLPASLMVGRVSYLTRAGVAIGLGILAEKTRLLGAGTLAKMVEGSLTVTLYDAIRAEAAAAGVNLGGMGYYLPGRGASAVPSASGNATPRLGMYATGPGANVMPMPQRGMAGVGSGNRSIGKSFTF